MGSASSVDSLGFQDVAHCEARRTALIRTVVIFLGKEKKDSSDIGLV
jgi:hypothetical protein